MGNGHGYVHGTGRRGVPPEEIKALTDTNAALQADNAQLQNAKADLEAASHLKEQKIRFLQVAVTVELACTGGLGVGLATCLAGASAQVALGSSFAVFFGVIMASMAILGYMRR